MAIMHVTQCFISSVLLLVFYLSVHPESREGISQLNIRTKYHFSGSLYWLKERESSKNGISTFASGVLNGIQVGDGDKICIANGSFWYNRMPLSLTEHWNAVKHNLVDITNNGTKQQLLASLSNCVDLKNSRHRRK